MDTKSSQVNASLEITTLGGLLIRCDGAIVTGFNSRKVEALLVYLALNRRSQPRESLADLLWDELPQDRAMNNLRVVLSNLRKFLGDHLHITREKVTMNPEKNYWVDAADLERNLNRALDSAASTGALSQETAGYLAQSIALYKGEFLQGFFVRNCREFDAWLVAERERLHHLVLDGLGKLVKWELEHGLYPSGMLHATQWLQLDPLSEVAHRQMMRLLAYNGQKSAALAQYEKCQEILAQELDVQPEEQTTTLFEQIREGDVRSATVEYQPSPPIAPKRKESIAPVEELMPTLPVFLADETRLPEPPRPIFVARERELKRLHTFLDTALADQGQVAFVCGEAGNGKTALTGEFVRLAQERNPNLLVAVGNCNAHAGVGDAYLPFRDVLGMLTGDVETQWAAGFLTRPGARRLWASIPQMS